MSKYQNPSANVNPNTIKIVLIGVILLIVIGVVASSAVQIVDAGNRGVILNWNAVNLDNSPLTEGLHFVTPFADSVVQMEVRTLKFIKATSAASADLQTVSTEITVNYSPNPERVHYLYKEIGLDYENRVISPTVEEVVKQVTANYNAEELITKRPQRLWLVIPRICMNDLFISVLSKFCKVLS